MPQISFLGHIKLLFTPQYHQANPTSDCVVNFTTSFGLITFPLVTKNKGNALAACTSHVKAVSQETKFFQCHIIHNLQFGAESPIHCKHGIVFTIIVHPNLKYCFLTGTTRSNVTQKLNSVLVPETNITQFHHNDSIPTGTLPGIFVKFLYLATSLCRYCKIVN